MSKKKSIVLVVLIVLALAGGAAFWLMPSGHAGEQAAQQPSGPMPVTVQVVQEEPVRVWKTYSARLHAVDYVEMRPQVSGRIDAVKFEDGQLVEKGDVLFVIDPRPFEANMTEAKAALAAAESQNNLAQRELKRAQDLIKTEAISQKVLDERRNAASIAANTLDGAKAMLVKAEVDLDHAYMKAPVSGRVSRPEITVGNLVQTGAGAPVLTTIVSTDGIYADFEMDEQTYLNDFREASAGTEKIPVHLDFDSGDLTYDGFIKSFDNHIDTATGTIRARAYFTNKDGALLPGMFATVNVSKPEAGKAILVSEQAVGTDQDRKFVYVVGDDGKTAYREVKLGAAVNGKRIITAGLNPGDKVIVEGLMKIRPDMPVAPQIQVAGEPADISETAPAAGAEQKTETKSEEQPE